MLQNEGSVLHLSTVFLYDSVWWTIAPLALQHTPHHLVVSNKTDPLCQIVHFLHALNCFMMRVHMSSISCLHVQIPCGWEWNQAVHVCKTLELPVPREPSVMENMLFLYILIKISLLIKPSHYLQFALNSISPLALDPLQRRRRRMAALRFGAASNGQMVASNKWSCDG